MESIIIGPVHVEAFDICNGLEDSSWLFLEYMPENLTQGYWQEPLFIWVLNDISNFKFARFGSLYTI